MRRFWSNLTRTCEYFVEAMSEAEVLRFSHEMIQQWLEPWVRFVADETASYCSGEACTQKAHFAALPEHALRVAKMDLDHGACWPAPTHPPPWSPGTLAPAAIRRSLRAPPRPCQARSTTSS